MNVSFFELFFKKDKNENKLCGDINKLVNRILDKKLSDIKIATALICLKKHKNPKIYAKVLDEITKHIEIKFKDPDSIEVGYPYKIKSFSPYFIISASIVLSLLPKSDIRTVFHGDSLNKGSIKDIFDYLNLSILTKEDSVNMLKNLNISFFNRSLFFPKLSSINYIREELNINDVFTYVEKFSNPVGSQYLITGAKNYEEVLFYRDLLKGRYKRFAIVIDREGFPDINDSTNIFIYGDKEEVLEINLLDFKAKKLINSKFDIKTHIRFLEDLLSRNLKDFENLLFINGALLLYLKGKVHSIKEGFDITKDLFSKYDYSQILKNLQYYANYLNYKNIYEL